MKERPILMSAPMVRAILDGQKTQTRRVVRPFINDLQKMIQSRMMEHQTTGQHQAFFNDGKSQDWFGTPCPYGQPGDRLWVRETWAEAKVDSKPGYLYKADPMFNNCEPGFIGWNWKPSIHMPRKAAREILQITSVTVEHVQDITELCAAAEGAPARRWGELRQLPMSLAGGIGSVLPSGPRYRFGFYELWDSINAARGYGWDVNPWVWVIEFRRLP